jgi:hypothetical protein
MEAQRGPNFLAAAVSDGTSYYPCLFAGYGQHHIPMVPGPPVQLPWRLRFSARPGCFCSVAIHVLVSDSVASTILGIRRNYRLALVT